MPDQPQAPPPATFPDPARIIDMASAFYGSCVLFAASDLGLFATLSERKRATVHELADACGLDARAARLLADACVAVGLATKQDDMYANTPESDAFLVPGKPGDLSRAIRYNRDVYAAWGALTTFARSGKPVEKPELHLGDDAERTRAFVHAMHGRAMGIGRAVVPMLSIPAGGRILDVGGGSGAYSMLVCEANPGTTSMVLDLPGIVTVSRELIEAKGMGNRVGILPGDYHSTPFPGDRDAVLILGVLHQESPDSIRDILARSREALRPGGDIHIMDIMTDATHCRPAFSALFAVNMALTTKHGWVFSDAELRGWLLEAGFSDVQRSELPPPMPHWLLSATRPA